MFDKKVRTAPASPPEPLLSVEERLTKAFAGLCSLVELSVMKSYGILADAEYDQLVAEYMYIDEGSPYSHLRSSEISR